MRAWKLCFALLLALCAPMPAVAQDPYPSRQIRWIVP